MGTEIRRVHLDDWQASRQLRLDALRDEAASIAFLESYEDAARRPDEFWEDRVRRSAEGDDAAQFVAVDDEALVGTVTVLVQPAGSHDYHGRLIEHRRAVLVGVYVRPQHRGAGLIDALIDAAAQWCRQRDVTELVLDVHRDNVRAQRAYRRAGFAPTGSTVIGPIGVEVDMARRLGGSVGLGTVGLGAVGDAVTSNNGPDESVTMPRQRPPSDANPGAR